MYSRVIKKKRDVFSAICPSELDGVKSQYVKNEIHSLRICPSELDEGGTRSGMTSDLTRPKQNVEKGNRAENVSRFSYNY